LVHPVIRQAVMIGFLGGFTTFSSFGLQTMALFTDGEWAYAALNIALSIVLCLAAVWIDQVIALQVVRLFNFPWICLSSWNVDTEEKINGFLPVLDEMMSGGLVTLEKARVIHYRADKERRHRA